MADQHWIHGMFQALDANGVPGLFPYLTDDVSFRFASYPDGSGREQFDAAWGAMAGHVTSLEHELAEVWEVPGAVICRGDVTYRLRDGRAVTVPFANVLYLRDGLICRYLIYVDASAVFGAAG